VTAILALRPFVPAKDFEVSKRFYQALGFRISHQDENIAVMKLGGQSFILQNFHVEALAENFMLQLLVRDGDAWWRDHVDAKALVDEFGIKPPRPPEMQPWGIKVGFLFDPSGVLWHIAESPF
jgi:uncharacterized glyoxalase superfamily protein PhnB